MKKKIIITWHDFHIFSRKLAQFLIDKSWKGIIAINREGLILAALLSRELQLQKIFILQEKEENLNTALKDQLNNDGRDYLFVTDIVENEDYIKEIKKNFSLGYFASIFVKNNEKNFVDKYILDIPEDLIIEQPWETNYSYVPPLKGDKID